MERDVADEDDVVVVAEVVEGALEHLAPRPADAADALGLAVCHLGSAGLRTAVAAEGPAPDGLTRAVGAALGQGVAAMIGSVRGEVLERSAAGEVLVEVGGVGYRALVPLSAIATLEPGAAAMLFTHLHVRDDSMVLFGFPTRDERDTFEVLIGANGVGPKLALAILSVHSPGMLRRALVEDDLDALTLVPGVGKRTAQRLMIELKARLEVPALEHADADLGPAVEPRRGAGGVVGPRVPVRRGTRRPRPAARRRVGRGPPARRVEAPGGHPCLGRSCSARPPTRSSGPRRPRSAPGGSTSSWARNA